MAARSVTGVLVAATAVGSVLTGCASAERPAATLEPTSYAGPPIGTVAPPAGQQPIGAVAPSAGQPAPATQSAAAPPAAVPGAPSGAPAAPARAPGAVPGKVSASTASEPDLVRALTAAGVPTPARWADEIIEYRPYPANDPNLGKLRQSLAKYNPAPGVVDKIVSVLTP